MSYILLLNDINNNIIIVLLFVVDIVINIFVVY
nr:MAG TPA: hypothetical protein [Bacteriophage sp.]